MITGTGQVANPESVVVRIAFELPVSEARQLIEQANEKYPSWEFAMQLRRLLEKTVGRIEREHSTEGKE